METITINNMPDSNELWKGIGGYFDSLGEILCEFIDNSISNFNANNPYVRTIIVKFKEMGGKYHVTVEDSGTGIKDLNAAFTLGSHAGAETLLNEHGFGFKHALATANPENDSWSIMTRTEELADSNSYMKIMAPYSLGALKAEKVQGTWPGELRGITGTMIEFDCTREMFMTIRRGISGNFTRSDSVIEILKEDLGFIYSGILKESGAHIVLVVEDIEGKQILRENVEQVMPSWEGYYDPKPGQEEVDLGAGKVSVEYVFGKIGDSENNRKYYKKNMASSGVEIRINGRLLQYRIIKQIWGRENHPTFNQFLAVINLKSNDASRLPKTKTSKNGLREGDERLEKLFSWIKEKCPNIPKNTQPMPEDLDERELFTQLKEAKKIHMQGNPTVETEVYAYDSIEEKVRIDLYISTGEELIIYEGKKDKTTVKDLYQLLMYWDGCVYDGKKPTKAILIAAEHTQSVKDVLRVINQMTDSNNSNYKFELKTWKDEGINYPA